MEDRTPEQRIAEKKEAIKRLRARLTSGGLHANEYAQTCEMIAALVGEIEYLKDPRRRSERRTRL